MPNPPNNLITPLSMKDCFSIYEWVRHMRMSTTDPESLLKLKFAHETFLDESKVGVILKHPMMSLYSVQTISELKNPMIDPQISRYFDFMVGANTTTSGQYVKAFSHQLFNGTPGRQGFYKHGVYLINPRVYTFDDPKSDTSISVINAAKSQWFDHVEEKALNSQICALGFSEDHAKAVIDRAYDSIPPFFWPGKN